MAASRTLSELVVVREWLHDTAPPPPRPDASTGYWRFTKHRVTQGRWTGNTGRAAENVVREMDPDAVVREAEIGRSLAGDDAVRAFAAFFVEVFCKGNDPARFAFSFF